MNENSFLNVFYWHFSVNNIYMISNYLIDKLMVQGLNTKNKYIYMKNRVFPIKNIFWVEND